PKHSFDVKLISFAIVITIVTLLLIVITSLFSTLFFLYKNYIYLFIIVLTAITLIITVYDLVSTRALSRRSLWNLETTTASAILGRNLDGVFINAYGEIALHRL